MSTTSTSPSSPPARQAIQKTLHKSYLSETSLSAVFRRSRTVQGGPATVTPPTSGGKAQSGLRKKTLVLDLDETLIHGTLLCSSGSYHQLVEVVVDNVSCLYYIYKRPHVDYFLKKVSEWYNIVIYTASIVEYADPVIDALDPNGTMIQRRYFRESCIQRGNNFIKDLSMIESDLSH
ncbi:Nuclear envelope morphology protein 1, partial [Dimargaris cristalligena]